MDSLRPGDPQRVGHYVLTGRLGAGGMGEVFFGRSRAGRPVAVKLVYPVYANDDGFRRRFRLEVEAGRKVGGFHAAQVIDADPDAERPWMVTAYVAGPSLEQVLREHTALPIDSVRGRGAGSHPRRRAHPPGPEAVEHLAGRRRAARYRLWRRAGRRRLRHYLAVRHRGFHGARGSPGTTAHPRL